jgi:hypothetical protein
MPPEQCRHNIRQGETVRNVLLVLFYSRNFSPPRSIASTKLFAEIDADAAIALDGGAGDSRCGRKGVGPLLWLLA